MSDCQHKRPYKTRELAEAAVIRKQAQPGFYIKPGYFLNVYECSECFLWHLGNTRAWTDLPGKRPSSVKSAETERGGPTPVSIAGETCASPCKGM